MTLRFRLASSILPALCLLAVERDVAVTESHGPSSTQEQMPGQPAPSVRPRMREHFSEDAAIRDAIIRGDLEAVRAPARSLAEHPQKDLPPAGLPYIGEMQRVAAELAATSDLSHAALGLARLAATCGACHTAVNATPTLMAALPRGEDATLTGRMRKHYRAADLLYRGLVVPSTHSWNLGAEALSANPATLDFKRDATPQPEVETLAVRLHDLAEHARKADNPKTRSEIYGQMLETCSECHKRQGVEMEHLAPRS